LSEPSQPALAENDERLLVLAPVGRDAPLTKSLLERVGLRCAICANVAELCREIPRGAAAVVIAEEVLVKSEMARLAAALREQEPWSDLPIILFTGEGATVQARIPTVEWLQGLGNVTLLDRPVRPITMVSTAFAAMRARRRQYEGRAALANQRAAVRQRDQFLAMLGHELRNPLGAIVLALDAIDMTRDSARQLAILRRQAGHLARLVDDLLDVARVTAGKIALQRRRVDVADIVERCIASIIGSHGVRAGRVRLHRPPRSLPVDGDPLRLEQVVANLLTNAVKYAPDGTIDVRVDGAGDDAVISVRDRGIGIPPEMLHAVFDLFVQAERSLDRAEGGMGIGLTLVRALVGLHGGSVAADSEGLGRGSTFTVRLPLAKGDVESERPRPEAPVPAEPAPVARSVLVVEDNEDSRELFALLLESFGHRVATAADGAAGVAIAIEQKPDVVFLDIGLPGITGYGVARRLRAELGGGVCLIAVTGYGQPDDRQRAIEAGFDLHLTKPIDVREVERLLAQPHLHAHRHGGAIDGAAADGDGAVGDRHAAPAGADGSLAPAGAAEPLGEAARLPFVRL